MSERGVKVCVLVKEVPDPTAAKRIDPVTGLLDRSGEKALNRYDAHALEAALRLRESGELAVSEIVAVTMGPASARRTLERAISLGADRAIHLCDPALAGTDAVGTGRVLARVLDEEQPDLVMLGQQSEDGAGFVVPAIVAERLSMPVVTQVSRIAVDDGGALRLERPTEHGYDALRVMLPAVVSVTYTINEPRYPSLKAVMAARRAPLRTVTLGELGIDPASVGTAGAAVTCAEHRLPAPRQPGASLDGGDGEAAVAAIVAWLEARGLL